MRKMQTNHDHTPRSGISRSLWVLLGFLAIAAYFLLSEHRAHFIAYLPFVLLAACLLLHLMHGHGGHGSYGARAEQDAERPPTSGQPHRHDRDPG
jgi:hypothetical protein